MKASFCCALLILTSLLDRQVKRHVINSCITIDVCWEPNETLHTESSNQYNHENYTQYIIKIIDYPLNSNSWFLWKTAQWTLSCQITLLCLLHSNCATLPLSPVCCYSFVSLIWIGCSYHKHIQSGLFVTKPARLQGSQRNNNTTMWNKVLQGFSDKVSLLRLVCNDSSPWA